MGRQILLIAAAAAALAGEAAAARFEASKIRFEDVTGTVEIVTNAGEEIDVAIRQGKTYRKVDVALIGGVVVLTGERWKEDDADNCCNRRIIRSVEPRHGRAPTTGEPVDETLFADYPTIVVTMPRNADAAFVDARMRLQMQAIDGALDLDGCYVYGEVGDAGSAAIGLVHGSRLLVGNIGSGLEIDVSGDADLRAGSAASVDVDIAGPGDVVIGPVDGMLDVSIAGSGSVRASRLDGPLTARIAGSGFVAVQSGRADRLKATIDGSGGVVFEGAAVDPDLRLYGSAEIRLGSLTGRITRAGQGEVYVAGVLQPRR